MVNNIIFTILIISLLASCHKKKDPTSPDPTPPICQLSSATFQGYDYYTMHYNKSNLIDSLHGYFCAYKIQYDNNNRVIKVIIDSLNPAYSIHPSPYYISYYYDSNGLLDRDTIYKPTNTSNIWVADSINTYTYTGNYITREDNIKIGGSHLYSTYFYNSSGDIVNQKNYDNSGVLLDSIALAYDLGKSYMAPFFFKDPVFATQKHPILLSWVYVNNVLDFSKSYTSYFTYNSDGYPVTERRNFMNTSIQDNSYTYSCK